MVAQETQKNTVYQLARTTSCSSPEEFGKIVSRVCVRVYLSISLSFYFSLSLSLSLSLSVSVCVWVSCVCLNLQLFRATPTDVVSLV